MLLIKRTSCSPPDQPRDPVCAVLCLVQRSVRPLTHLTYTSIPPQCYLSMYVLNLTTRIKAGPAPLHCAGHQDGVRKLVWRHLFHTCLVRGQIMMANKWKNHQFLKSVLQLPLTAKPRPKRGVEIRNCLTSGTFRPCRHVLCYH